MKLTSIELNNFRQFKGPQRFPLATTSERNVTLLFGANGAGKTTLLNAFTWALYGELSQDVEEQIRLVNDSIWRDTRIGDSVEVSVTVTFEHEGLSFKAQRSRSRPQTLPLRSWNFLLRALYSLFSLHSIHGPSSFGTRTKEVAVASASATTLAYERCG